MVDFISDTGIANLALSHVGHGPITLFTDQTEEGSQVRTWYAQTRRIVLEAYDWNFARKREKVALHSDTISETSTDPLAGVWGFRYQYPSDALVIRKMQNSMSPPGDSPPFEIEMSLDGTSKSIVTDVEDAVAVYTWDQESPAMFSGVFILTFSHLLASHMAFALTRKTSIETKHLKIYQGLLPSAQAQSANESVGKPPREAEHIRSRR